MSVLIAAIYGLATLRPPVLLRRPIGAGAPFGIAVFLVMNLVVVPLSAAPHPRHPPSLSVIGLNLAAMILFGLIVAISQARSAVRPPR